MAKKTKMVEVVSAKRPTLWYADLIGQQFKVETETSWGYVVVSKTKMLKDIIFKEDCKIV